MSIELINEQLELENKGANAGGEMSSQEGAEQSNEGAQQSGASEMGDQQQQSNTQENGEGQQQEPPVDEPKGDGQQEPATPQFDWNVISERSGGLIKDEETFNSSLEKLTQFDEVSKKVTELESNQFKPANDFVAKFNEFVLKGADKNQIETFLKVNMIGDLSSMDAREILVTKDMLINGTPRDVAEYNIDNKYDFALYSDDSIEYRALKHNMDIESKSAINELNQYKAEISQVNNPDAEAAETERLQQVAQEEQRMSFVKKEAPKMAQAFVSKMTVEVDKDKQFEHSYNDDFKKNIDKHIVEFFKVTKLPLTDENIPKVADYLELTYFKEHKKDIIKDMYNKMNSELEEKYANKYQNIGSLPKEGQNPNPAQNNQPKSQREIQESFAKQIGL